MDMAAVLAAYGAQVRQNTTPEPRSRHTAAVAEPRHLYRALVGYRAQLAASRGYTYLTGRRPADLQADPGAGRLQLGGHHPVHVVTLASGTPRPATRAAMASSSHAPISSGSAGRRARAADPADLVLGQRHQVTALVDHLSLANRCGARLVSACE